MKPLIEVRGLDGLASYFKDFPDLSQKAARLAINASARYASRVASKRIREQVAFKRSYLGEAGSANAKIQIKYASGNDISAVVLARDRPTSLARFAVGTPTFGRRKKGTRPPGVRVKTGGGVQRLKNGFYVRLNRGPIFTVDHFNLGLAVRLKEGEPKPSPKASPLGGGTYLLYGPSVAQVFDTVREDIAPEVGDYVRMEFLRQFERLARG